ncbi:MAG: RES family NAD+ phosphorylase [Alphaproteobacteria bacterium]
MKAWRIAAARFARFDGEGARLYGGRWNSPGRPLIYGASHLSLAILELLVRLPTNEVPDDYVQIEITIPDDVATETIDSTDVPGWNARDQRASRSYGDAWLDERRTAVLLVPAVAVPEEHNVLINPFHPDRRRVTHTDPEPVMWDKRLFQR